MRTLTRLPRTKSGVGTLSRSAGEGPSPSPALRERGDRAHSARWVRVVSERWVGEGSGVRPYLLLCLLCLILYAPGLAAIPPLDRDEARFAQATRQMLETGDFVRIRFQ